MKVFILIGLFFTHLVNATTWYDLELNDELINHDALVINSEISLSYPSHSKFIIQDLIPLPINVVLYQLKAKKCDQPIDQEMILMNAPSYNNREVVVGVTHNTECVIEIFIENSDLFAESFFERVEK